MNRLVLTLAPLALWATGAVAQHPGPGWRPARCVVENGQNEEWRAAWRGPCYFLAERNGSFAIQPQRGSFPDGGEMLSVSIIAAGQAEVRILTQRGVNSRWGEARRSTRDRACWIGEDFSVCAY